MISYFMNRVIFASKLRAGVPEYLNLINIYRTTILLWARKITNLNSIWSNNCICKITFLKRH
jgi:hypothetical protein